MTQTIEIIGGGGGGAIEIGGAGERHATISVQGTGMIPVPKYEGPYEFTPTAEEQTVPIAQLQARQDITINPIPSNYGLVTYNGHVITIS
jgi:hypothetical protein